MKRKLILLMLFLSVIGTTTAQKVNNPYSFRYFLRLMSFGYKGQSLDDYKRYAEKRGLKLIYHEVENREIYMVWADQVAYATGHMTETYTRLGDRPRCINMDLTPNGKGRYSPIGVTIVFPDKEQQREFWQQGLNTNCLECKEMEDTDIDATWSNVSCLRYNMAPGRLLTWHYIFFYEKDGMSMCTFLF